MPRCFWRHRLQEQLRSCATVEGLGVCGSGVEELDRGSQRISRDDCKSFVLSSRVGSATVQIWTTLVKSASDQGMAFYNNVASGCMQSCVGRTSDKGLTIFCGLLWDETDCVALSRSA